VAPAAPQEELREWGARLHCSRTSEVQLARLTAPPERITSLGQQIGVIAATPWQMQDLAQGPSGLQ
jgi:hypothetical protein